MEMAGAPVRSLCSPKPATRRPSATAALGAILAAIVSSMGTGCAPTTSHLLATHQYGQALCSVSDKSPDDPARVAVRDATDTAFDGRLFVRAVTREEWKRTFGDDPKLSRFLDGYALVFVGVEHSRLAVSARTLVTITDEASPTHTPGSRGSATEQSLASAFGETPARGHDVGGEGRLGRLARALTPSPDRGLAGNTGSILAGVLELATLGIFPVTELYPGKGKGPSHVGPTYAEQEAAAPAMRTTARGIVTTLASIPHAWDPEAILVPRPKGKTHIEVRVLLDQPNQAHRRCDDKLVYQLPLAPAPTFEESIGRTFPPEGVTDQAAASTGGGGLRSLREFRVADAQTPSR